MQTIVSKTKAPGVEARQGWTGDRQFSAIAGHFVMAVERLAGPSRAASTQRRSDGSADLGDGNGASQASGAGGGLDHLESVHAGLGRDRVLGVAPASGEEGRQLEA